MTVYGATTFSVVMGDDGWRPDWGRESNIARRHIPGGPYDDLMDTGLGNWRIVLPVLLEDDSYLALLYGYVGTSARALTDLFGVNYASVYLVGVRNPRRHEYETRWQVELELERQGT
jgi:hypothetical protein